MVQTGGVTAALIGNDFGEYRSTEHNLSCSLAGIQKFVPLPRTLPQEVRGLHVVKTEDYASS